MNIVIKRVHLKTPRGSPWIVDTVTLDEILKSSNLLYRVRTLKDIHVFEALHISAKKTNP